jgi:hypothetical protein
LKTIEGDLLDIEEGLICHQVNTCGVFNAGLAKQIRIKYPIVFGCYSKRCELPTARGCGLPEIYSGTLSTSLKITAGKPVGFIFSPCS